MKASRAAIDRFFEQRRMAVVGVSRKRAHFSRIVFSSLRSRGYDAIPVHPSAGEIDGVAAAPALDAVVPPPEAVLILTPKVPESIIGQARAAGARVVWFYRKPAFPVDAHPPGIEVVAGECPLMFMPDAGWIHTAHRKIRSLFGTLPQ
jgi:predicted CoA-binding protein